MIFSSYCENCGKTKKHQAVALLRIRTTGGHQYIHHVYSKETATHLRLKCLKCGYTHNEEITKEDKKHISVSHSEMPPVQTDSDYRVKDGTQLHVLYETKRVQK